jgi:hypothetical protein
MRPARWESPTPLTPGCKRVSRPGGHGYEPARPRLHGPLGARPGQRWGLLAHVDTAARVPLSDDRLTGYTVRCPGGRV